MHKILAIVSHQRCGSFMLGSAIGSHPDVTWTGELSGQPMAAGKTDRPVVKTKWECFSVKYTNFHVAPAATVYLHMLRNPVSAAKSDLKNRLSKAMYGYRHRSHFVDGNDPLPVPEPSEDAIVTLASGIQRLQSVFYHGCPRPVIEVSYEEISNGEGSIAKIPFVVAERILDGIDLPRTGLVTKYVRSKR